MNKEIIKKLAKATLSNGSVDQKVVKFALSNLSRRELITYLAALKKAIFENSVRIISADELPTGIKKTIMSKFKNKVVFFEQDKTLSAGIKVIINDTTFDLTLGGYIKTALEQLKA